MHLHTYAHTILTSGTPRSSSKCLSLGSTAHTAHAFLTQFQSRPGQTGRITHLSEWMHTWVIVTLFIFTAHTNKFKTSHRVIYGIILWIYSKKCLNTFPATIKKHGLIWVLAWFSQHMKARPKPRFSTSRLTFIFVLNLCSFPVFCFVFKLKISNSIHCQLLWFNKQANR